MGDPDRSDEGPSEPGGSTSTMRTLFWELPHALWTPWDMNHVPTDLQRILAGASAFDRALDLGCGTGRLTAYLAHCGLTAHGVDISSTAVETARERPQDATYWVGDVTDPDAVAATVAPPYDLVTDYGCLHSVPPDERAAYRETLLAVTESGTTYLLWTARKPYPYPPDVEGLLGEAFAIERQKRTRLPLQAATPLPVPSPAMIDFHRLRRR